MSTGQMDFGYPWWLSWGHLVILIPAAAALALALKRQWPRGVIALCALVALWAGAGFCVMRFVMPIGSAAAVPTGRFLERGDGRVLDLGAGTGRSSIMVLTSRPRATLVAYDLFGDSFDHHFGRAEAPQERLRRNLEAAGVAGRATIQQGDMRELPFPAASFEAVVSAYAIDHLGAGGIRQTLAESARVLKPGGDLLLVLVQTDGWMRFAFTPAAAHAGIRPQGWWTREVEQAGFRMVDAGRQPATLWMLARRETKN